MRDQRSREADREDDEEGQEEEEQQPDIGNGDDEIAPGLAVEPDLEALALGKLGFRAGCCAGRCRDAGHRLLLQHDGGRGLEGEPDFVFPHRDPLALAGAPLVDAVDPHQALGSFTR